MARILICDDAVFMRMTIKETLERAGHEIVGEAADADEGVVLYKKLKPDAVTMDMVMKTPGVEAVKRIMKFDPKAKIVICSVLNAQESDVVEAVKSGALGIVAKPIKREVLVAEINRVLGIETI